MQTSTPSLPTDEELLEVVDQLAVTLGRDPGRDPIRKATGVGAGRARRLQELRKARRQAERARGHRVQLEFDARCAEDVAAQMQAEAERLYDRAHELMHTARLLRRYTSSTGPCPRCG